MTTMTDRCDCPYPDPMTYGGPNPLCPEHGDVGRCTTHDRRNTMPNHTPDDEQVREQYTQEQPPQIGSVAEKRAEFDRFIAKVRADAWDEGLDAGQRSVILKEYTPDNPYRQEDER